GEENTAAGRRAGEGQPLTARQRKRERHEFLAGTERGIDGGPRDVAQPGVRGGVDTDEPVAAAARTGILTGEDDVVGEQQRPAGGFPHLGYFARRGCRRSSQSVDSLVVEAGAGGLGRARGGRGR